MKSVVREREHRKKAHENEWNKQHSGMHFSFSLLMLANGGDGTAVAFIATDSVAADTGAVLSFAVLYSKWKFFGNIKIRVK